MDIIYFGVFLNTQQTPISLPSIPNQHLTLSFRPNSDKIQHILPHIGENVELEISKYGNNGKNEGYFVSKWEANRDINQIISQISYPHITLGCSKNSKPVFTPKLFDGSEQNVSEKIHPIHLEGRVGAFCSDGKIRFQIEPDLGLFFFAHNKSDICKNVLNIA